MEEILTNISNYTVTVVIVALFLWDWFANKKDMKDTLDVIKETSLNISKSLDLLQKSMDRHDEKLNRMDDKINNITIERR